MNEREIHRSTFPFLGLIRPDVMKELMKHESYRTPLSVAIIRRLTILKNLENDLGAPFTYLGEDLLRIAKDCLQDNVDSQLSMLVAHRVRAKFDPINEMKRLATYEYNGAFDSRIIFGINDGDIDPWEHLTPEEMTNLIQRLGYNSSETMFVAAAGSSSGDSSSWGRSITAPVTTAKMEALIQVQKALNKGDGSSGECSVPFALLHRKNWDPNVSDSEAAELICRLGKVGSPNWGSEGVIPLILTQAALAATPIAEQLILNHSPDHDDKMKIHLLQEMTAARDRGEELAVTGVLKPRAGYLPLGTTGNLLNWPTNEGFPMVIALVDRVFKGEPITSPKKGAAGLRYLEYQSGEVDKVSIAAAHRVYPGVNVNETVDDMSAELEQVDYLKMAEKHNIRTVDDWQQFADRIATYVSSSTNEDTWMAYLSVLTCTRESAIAAGNTECVNGLSRSSIRTPLAPLDLRYFKGKEHELDTKVLQQAVVKANPRERLLAKAILASRGAPDLSEANSFPSRKTVTDFLVDISLGKHTEEDKELWNFWDAADMLHLDLKEWHARPYEFWAIMLDLWAAKNDSTAPEMVLTAEAALESNL